MAVFIDWNRHTQKKNVRYPFNTFSKNLILFDDYSPKQSSLKLTVWVPLVWMAFFTLVYCLDFFTPTNLGLYLVGVGGGCGWGVLPWKIFRCLKMVFFAQFFFKQVQLIGGTIFFFSTNKAILELKNQKWTQKSTFFAKVPNHVLTILGPKKSIFGLFQSCLRVVQELLGHCFWT